MTHPHTTPPTIPYATPAEFGRGKFVVRSSRALGITIIAAGGLVLGMCTFLFLAGGTGRGDSNLAFVIGAGCVALGVHQLRIRAPLLIFSDARFISTIDNRVELLWSDLASAEVVTDSDDVTYLILRLADPSTAKPPTLQDRPTFRRPREAGDDDIVLPVSGLDVSPERILRQIRGRIAHAHTGTT